MFDIQEFIDVYSTDIVFGGSLNTHCNYKFKTGNIQYIYYSGKLEITKECNDSKDFHRLTYDPGMDWIVYSTGRNNYNEVTFRKHYKQVSKGLNETITPKILSSITMIIENILLDNSRYLMDKARNINGQI